MKSPRLTLVGAGPGDPELITLKGIQALRTADVVLYDALANPLLLDYAPADAQRIFVGKRKDSHSVTQEEINTMITSMAFQHGHVVRLKGGDPFLLGRGMEEIEVARALGIETTYVPGVSSALSVPGLVGIPLTHRETSKSVWIVSGTSASGALTEDLRHAARSSATVVILMGLTALNDIVRIFSEELKSDSPVAVIQNGSMENQLAVAATISTIERAVSESQIGTPAIIVVGDVVKFFDQKRKESVGREQQDQL